jgi:hypothetical protein
LHECKGVGDPGLGLNVVEGGADVRELWFHSQSIFSRENGSLLTTEGGP